MSTVNKDIKYIYALRNTLSDEIFYVGYSYNPIRRKSQHISGKEFAGGGKEKCAVIQRLKTAGLKPSLEILDFIHCNEDMWVRQFEKVWIEYMRECGHPLTNYRHFQPWLKKPLKPYSWLINTTKFIGEMECDKDRQFEIRRLALEGNCLFQGLKYAIYWPAYLHYYNLGLLTSGKRFRFACDYLKDN